jgi:hypothetical protein
MVEAGTHIHLWKTYVIGLNSYEDLKTVSFHLSLFYFPPSAEHSCSSGLEPLPGVDIYTYAQYPPAISLPAYPTSAHHVTPSVTLSPCLTVHLMMPYLAYISICPCYHYSDVER